MGWVGGCVLCVCVFVCAYMRVCVVCRMCVHARVCRMRTPEHDTPTLSTLIAPHPAAHTV
jgi:hypothetical protein